jgi:hypothetical protein
MNSCDGFNTTNYKIRFDGNIISFAENIDKEGSMSE